MSLLYLKRTNIIPSKMIDLTQNFYKRTLIAVSVATAVAALSWANYAAAIITEPTNTVKGRKSLVSDVAIINLTASGLNPAQGDQLQTTFTY